MLITTNFGVDEPHVYLARRSWDDYGYKTMFDAVLYDSSGETRPLGSVKILRSGQKHTTLLQTDGTLPDDVCSLGQSPTYDDRAKQLADQTGFDLRRALRDVRDLPPDERARFTSEPGFQESLLRFAPARFLYARAIGSLPRALEVRLRAELSGFSAPHDLALSLDPDRLLGRMAVIIGENGTGKTRFLDAIARALSGIEPKHLAAGTPAVSRVLALSCSAFDQFFIPQPLLEDSYFYIGLRSRRGLIDVNDAADEVVSRVQMRIRPDPERSELWAEVMSDLELKHLVDLPHIELQRAVSQLGAGFKFACYVLTRVISVIEPRSFILFDEPENHTHPRLLSMIMLALHRVLDRFSSFALLATHSPMVVQELPRRQVHLLRCASGSRPSFVTPPDETFGASLGELTHKLFAMDHERQNFDVLLRRLVDQHGAARVHDELGAELALAARLLVDTLASKQEGD